jgi:hypothetical protein
VPFGKCVAGESGREALILYRSEVVFRMRKWPRVHGTTPPQICDLGGSTHWNPVSGVIVATCMRPPIVLHVSGAISLAFGS